MTATRNADERADEILHSSWDGDFLTLTLNRPARGNALSGVLVEALLGTLGAAEERGCAGVALRGAGRHFCTGFDLSDLDSVSDGDLLQRFVRLELLLQTIFHAPYPTYVFAQGRNFGAGVDIVCVCSERIATPNARFRMPGWQFDIALGTRRLMARVGADRARAVLRNALEFSADEALKWGLLTDVADEAAWGDMLSGRRAVWAQLSPTARRHLLALTVVDTRAADMADLALSAGRPGLIERIRNYRARG